MSGRAKHSVARRVALGVSAVVVAAVIFELGRSAFAFRPTVASEDYESLAQARADSEFPDAPVYIGQRWLDPQARMSWPELAQPKWLARPDVGTVSNFWVVDHRSNRSFPQAIAEDLWPEQERPRRVQRHRSGGLTLSRYQFAAAKVVGDLGDQSITATVDGTKCKGTIDAGMGRITCGGGRTGSATTTIGWTEVEVDYRPRTCLAIDMPGGGTLDLSAPDFPLEHAIVGHVGFGDFNARIRNDAPVSLQLAHDGRELMRTVASDEQGWHRFRADGAPRGQTGLEIRIRMAPAGEWQKSAPSRRDVKTLCLELRSVEELDAL